MKAYVEGSVGPVLMQALYKMSIEKPNEPLEFVANYLLEHNPERGLGGEITTEPIPEAEEVEPEKAKEPVTMAGMVMKEKAETEAPPRQSTVSDKREEEEDIAEMDEGF
jgi:hypothetical protein